MKGTGKNTPTPRSDHGKKDVSITATRVYGAQIVTPTHTETASSPTAGEEGLPPLIRRDGADDVEEEGEEGGEEEDEEEANETARLAGCAHVGEGEEIVGAVAVWEKAYEEENEAGDRLSDLPV